MHRQGFHFVCLLLACAIAITPTQAQPQIALAANTTSVEGAYATFRKALEAADAKSASALVTKNTLDEYDKCRKLALSSSDTDFSELNQLSVLMVFQLRFLLSRQQLERMSGRDIFEWGVSKGLVNKKTLSDINLHEIQHEGPVAYATVTNRGLVATDTAFTFRQEEGQWKIDLMGILHNAGSQLDAIRKQAGKSNIEMAIFLLERTYQKPISPSILNGPLK